MINDDKIFTRYDIYKILIKKYDDYKGKDEYYELENFLAEKFKCKCTDCDGHDFSGPCHIEKYFSKNYWNIVDIKMV